MFQINGHKVIDISFWLCEYHSLLRIDKVKRNKKRHCSQLASAKILILLATHSLGTVTGSYMLSPISLSMLSDGQMRHPKFGRHEYLCKDIVVLCGCSVREWIRKTQVMSTPQFHLGAWVSHCPIL
jgi:hypothetical protein